MTISKDLIIMELNKRIKQIVYITSWPVAPSAANTICLVIVIISVEKAIVSSGGISTYVHRFLRRFLPR